MSDPRLNIENIIKALRFYATDLEAPINKHKRVHLFPQNEGADRWDPRHGTTSPFKEPSKLRLEGAKSALEAMANHIEAHFELAKEGDES